MFNLFLEYQYILRDNGGNIDSLLDNGGNISKTMEVLTYQLYILQINYL